MHVDLWLRHQIWDVSRSLWENFNVDSASFSLSDLFLCVFGLKNKFE